MEAIGGGLFNGMTATMAKGNPEKISKATALKEEGNVLFKAGDLSGAVTKYSHATLYFTGLVGLTPAQEAEIKQLNVSCQLNLAVAQYKLGKFERSLVHAKKAAELSPENTKAVFRVGKAYLALRDLDRAKEWIDKALKAEPTNQEIRAESQLLTKKLAEAENKAKKTFAGMFDKLATP